MITIVILSVGIPARSRFCTIQGNWPEAWPKNITEAGIDQHAIGRGVDHEQIVGELRRRAETIFFEKRSPSMKPVGWPQRSAKTEHCHIRQK